MSLISGDNVKSLLRRHLKDTIIKKENIAASQFLCRCSLFVFCKGVNKKANPIISLSFIF